MSVVVIEPAGLAKLPALVEELERGVSEAYGKQIADGQLDWRKQVGNDWAAVFHLRTGYSAKLDDIRERIVWNHQRADELTNEIK